MLQKGSSYEAFTWRFHRRQHSKIILRERGPLEVGNHLNQYFDFAIAEKYAESIKTQGNDRVTKSSKDSINGRLAEEVLIYLLEAYFKHNRLNLEVMGLKNNRNLLEQFKIVHEKLFNEKIFDIDIFIKNRDNSNKYFLLSVKGTSRERIGQFISNLFLMDDRLIEKKYNDRYYLEFKRQGISIKYGFVCYDWAKSKDFTKYNRSGRIKKTIKETEVLLINDDNYMGGGVTVLNDEENLDGVINFGELVGKVANFLR